MDGTTTGQGFSTVALTPRVGAEIKIDLDTLLSGRYAVALRDVLEQRGVLICRGLELDLAQQTSFARTMGTIHPYGKDEIFEVSLDKSVAGYAAEYLRATFFWHIDNTTQDLPTRASILIARKLASKGGETEFCNTYAAWEDLPLSEKKAIDKLRVVHLHESSQRRVNPNPTDEELQRWRAQKPKIHPLVWTHRSGRKSLVLGCTISHIEGMSPEESQSLLDRLTEWATQPKFVYRHHWQVGDLLMWDNTGVMHRVTPYDADSGRLMTRVTIQGEEPLV